MNIRLNGKPKSVSPAILTLSDLLSALSMTENGIIIEHNGTLHKDDFHQIRLQEHDTVEVIHFMGGGN